MHKLSQTLRTSSINLGKEANIQNTNKCINFNLNLNDLDIRVNSSDGDSSLNPLKMRTPCNGDFFTPDSINRGGQTDARW